VRFTFQRLVCAPLHVDYGSDPQAGSAQAGGALRYSPLSTVLVDTQRRLQVTREGTPLLKLKNERDDYAAS
jgi:hypothetical protein